MTSQIPFWNMGPAGPEDDSRHARMEARIALEALIARYPAFRRKREISLELRPSSFIYGLRHVPVTLS